MRRKMIFDRIRNHVYSEQLYFNRSQLLFVLFVYYNTCSSVISEFKVMNDMNNSSIVTYLYVNLGDRTRNYCTSFVQGWFIYTKLPIYIYIYIHIIVYIYIYIHTYMLHPYNGNMVRNPDPTIGLGDLAMESETDLAINI